MDTLEKIIEYKKQEVASQKRQIQLRDQKFKAGDQETPRSFYAGFHSNELNIIAEIKKASPSAGIIRQDFDPVKIAHIYEDNFAKCISVLTDEHFFMGRLDYLTSVKKAVKIPVLRKDFIVEHHGQTYMINPQEAENIQRSVGFTVGEVITVKTFLDYAVKRKSRGLENVDFNLSLEQIATILRKPGERLPVHVNERTRFIDARKREFADLPYPMAIDIIFFLMTITSESKTT